MDNRKNLGNNQNLNSNKLKDRSTIEQKMYFNNVKKNSFENELIEKKKRLNEEEVCSLIKSYLNLKKKNEELYQENFNLKEETKKYKNMILLNYQTFQEIKKQKKEIYESAQLNIQRKELIKKETYFEHIVKQLDNDKNGFIINDKKNEEINQLKNDNKKLKHDLEESYRIIEQLKNEIKELKKELEINKKEILKLNSDIFKTTDKKYEIMKKNEKLIRNENEKLITNGNEKITLNENEKLITNENEKIITNENEKIITNENEKIITNEKEKIITNEIEKIITNEIEKIITNENEKIITNEIEKIITNENEKIITNENKKLITNEKNKEELIKNLQNIKSDIDLYYIKIINNNDILNEKYEKEKKLFEKRNEQIKIIEDQINILKEQKQVEKNFFENNELEIIETQFIGLKEIFYKEEKELNYIKKIQIDIEDYQKKIMNFFSEISIKKESIYISLEIIQTILIDFKQKSEEFENKISNLKKYEIKNPLMDIKDKITKILNLMFEKAKIIPNQNKNYMPLSQRLKQNLKKNYDSFFLLQDSIEEEEEEEVSNLYENLNSKEYSQPELLKKNWEQIVILKEDGAQEIEIKLILKAMGLGNNKFYYNWSYYFDFFSDVNLIFTKINNQYINLFIQEQQINFHFNLKDNDEIPIHFKYKTKNKNINLYYYKLNIGLSSFLAKRKAKFKLICPEYLTIIKFEKNIFEYDKNGNYYFFDNYVPDNGLMTEITISLTEAKWKIVSKEIIISNHNIEDTVLITPILYEGGNNIIIKKEIETSVGNKINNDNIKINKNNKYEISYKHLKSKEAYFTNIVELKNSTKKDYEINNKKVQIPKDQIENKLMFKQFIKNEILKNDNSKDEIYIKIAKYVKKIMKYKLSLSGKNLTATEILKKKEGVCEHYTILLNALLNSINIKALYVTGNCVNTIKKGKDGSHAWTICQINNKWIPIDCTWGFFTGKLPTSHIFAGFDNKDLIIKSFDNAVLHHNLFEVKFLGKE